MAKINWLKAFQDYVSDETMSYAKISAKYGISETVIAERASEEDWVGMRKETLAKARQSLPEKLGEDMVELSRQHNNVARVLIGSAWQAISKKDKAGNPILHPKSFRDVREAFVDGVSIQRKVFSMDAKEQQNIAIMNNVEILPRTWYVSRKDNNKPK